MPYIITKFGFIMLGSAFLASFIPPEFSFVLGIVLLIGAGGFLFFGKDFRKTSAFFLAAMLGFSLVAAKIYFEFYPAKALGGMSASITGTVTEVSAGEGNPVYTVKTDSVSIKGAPQKITLRLSGWDENYAEAFDKISCEVTFFVSGKQSSEEFFDDRTEGISIYANSESPLEVIGKEDRSLRFFFHSIREKISSVIYGYFIDWHAPFMEKLLIGRGFVDYEIKTAFRRSGMSHILAISGMHMVIIVGLFEKLFFYKKSEGKLRKAETVLLILLTGAYMFIGGLGMSVLRSGFMLISHYLSRLFLSGSKSLDNLGIAIFAVLIIDPMAACDAGFLMSVVTCCAISVFAPPLKKRIFSFFHYEGKGIFSFIVESICVSCVAFLAVLPITAILFGEISLVSPFSNLFAGFFAQYSIVFGIFTVILGSIPFLGFFAGGTAFIAMVCNRILLEIAEFFSGFSFAYIEAGDFWFFIWLIGSSVLIIGPALYSKSFRYIKHSAVMSVFVLLFGIFLDLLFFSGVSEIGITALEHGTAISCSKDNKSVLIVRNLDSGDRFAFDQDGDFDHIISIDALSSSAEHEIYSLYEPESAFLSTDDFSGQNENVFPVSDGTFTLSEGENIKILSESAVCLETNGIRVLYIFKECDIMDIEPKFRRADIIILDGVSPEDFPTLRCDYLILRKMGGFYSGTNEIITLKNGKAEFFAFEGNLKKGGAAG